MAAGSHQSQWVATGAHLPCYHIDLGCLSHSAPYPFVSHSSPFPPFSLFSCPFSSHIQYSSPFPPSFGSSHTFSSPLTLQSTQFSSQYGPSSLTNGGACASASFPSDLAPEGRSRWRNVASSTRRACHGEGTSRSCLCARYPAVCWHFGSHFDWDPLQSPPQRALLFSR